MFPTFGRDQTRHVSLDLDRILNKNPQSTIVCEVEGDWMHDAGICSGDTVLVDRMKHPSSGSIILLQIDDNFLIRHLGVDEQGKHYIHSRKPGSLGDKVYPQESMRIIGVVVSSFRTYDD